MTTRHGAAGAGDRGLGRPPPGVKRRARRSVGRAPPASRPRDIGRAGAPGTWRVRDGHAGGDPPAGAWAAPGPGRQSFSVSMKTPSSTLARNSWQHASSPVARIFETAPMSSSVLSWKLTRTRVRPPCPPAFALTSMIEFLSQRARCDVSPGCSLRDLFNRGPAGGSWVVSKPTHRHQGEAPDERPRSSTNLPSESSPSRRPRPGTGLAGRAGRRSRRDQPPDHPQVARPLPGGGPRRTRGSSAGEACPGGPPADVSQPGRA